MCPQGVALEMPGNQVDTLQQFRQDVYACFQRSRDALFNTVDALLTKPEAGKWLWLGIDVSRIARPQAVTSADRTAQPVPNLPACKKPITFGWQFSTLAVLPAPPSNWTISWINNGSHREPPR